MKKKRPVQVKAWGILAKKGKLLHVVVWSSIEAEIHRLFTKGDKAVPVLITLDMKRRKK